MAPPQNPPSAEASSDGKYLNLKRNIITRKLLPTGLLNILSFSGQAESLVILGYFDLFQDFVFFNLELITTKIPAYCTGAL